MDRCNISEIDIRTVEPDTLVDIRDIKINEELPRVQRMAEFISQIKNPYCFKVGKIVVGVEYSNDGISFEQRLDNYLQTL